MSRYYEIKSDPKKHREQLDRINKWRKNDRVAKDKMKAEMIRDQFLATHPYWDVVKDGLEEKEVYLLTKHFCLDNSGKQPSVAAIAVELGVTKQGGHHIKHKALEKLAHLEAKVELAEKLLVKV